MFVSRSKYQSELEAGKRDYENRLEEAQRRLSEQERLIEDSKQKTQELERQNKMLEAKLRDWAQEKKSLQENQSVSHLLEDRGYQILMGFKVIPEYLNKVLGRSFIITVAEEFKYKEAVDLEGLEQVLVDSRNQAGNNLHTFRDEVKSGYSFRVTYSFSSKDYFINTPNGKLTYDQLMFPSQLKSGPEISSLNKSAIYLALKNKCLQSAVLPETIFGAPLLSYAFPVFAENGSMIGAVSFSNDISQIVSMAKSLGNIVSSDSDAILHRLANMLKSDLEESTRSAAELKEESLQSQEAANQIKRKGTDIIQLSERLKVLALNTAIEATKVGKNGKGVGIIAEQMRAISETTRKSLQNIYKDSNSLYEASRKVFETSSRLEKNASSLQQESGVLFNTSFKITSQKDELAALVRMSIDEIAQNQEDLNNIFMLIK